MAIVTSTGELYVTRMLNPKDTEYYDYIIPNELIMVADIPKVKKVICCEFFTAILTYDGKIYCYGIFYNNNYTAFTKINSENQIIDIDGSLNTLVVLDDNNNIYEIGERGFAHSVSGGNAYLMKKNNNILQISAIGGYGVALKQNNDVIFWGVRNVGKAANEPYSGIAKGTKKAEKILNNGSTIFVFKNNKIIKVQLDD